MVIAIHYYVINCVMIGWDGEEDKNNAIQRFMSMKDNLRARLKRWQV